MLYQTALGVSIFDNSKISSVRFAQSIVFLNQGGYDGKSWTRYSHRQDTKLITNSKSLRNGFRFFHVVFILDTLNKRLSWDLQNSNRLNHQLNSLQQWLNWLKNMFWMFLSSGPHGPEPGWSATHDLQSTSLGSDGAGYELRYLAGFTDTGMELLSRVEVAPSQVRCLN